MKEIYINEVLKISTEGKEIRIIGWVQSMRQQKNQVFLILEDSTGRIQIVVDKACTPILFSDVKEIKIESSILVCGKLQKNQNSWEILSSKIDLIGEVTESYDPHPREDFDIFSHKYRDYLLKNRHLFVRNKKMQEIIKFRHLLMGIIHDWFREKDFIEIFSPVITQIPLYEDKSAFSIDYFGTKAFLTQCVAFHLESVVHGLERVYSIGPSFRAEKSKSKRHLAEYWHLKGEIAFMDFEEIITFVEKMIYEISSRIITEGKSKYGLTNFPELGSLPYPRITYTEVCEFINANGYRKIWGTSLNDEETRIISKQFRSPFWITGMPEKIEPFIYELDSNNPKITKTADLIASEGFGELLGVAEKIWDPKTLRERLELSNNEHEERYDWYLELREYGSVPHSGFGVGIERLIRWLLRLDHVQDALPFPRTYTHKPSP